MKHTYKISGMSCNGCRTNAENALNTIKGIKATVTLNPPEAIVETDAPISIEKLQEALSAKTHYTITPLDVQEADANHSHAIKNKVEDKPQDHKTKPIAKKGNGTFYCPMHCEGDKTYDKAGDCPVCGMDLVEEAAPNKATQYTCPMHPEIVEDEPGACPICGMDLVPMEASE